MYKILKLFLLLTTLCVKSMGIQNETFSKQWMEKYSKDTDTCPYESNSTIYEISRYTWLGCGLGFNINSLTNSWLHSLIIGKMENFSIIIGKGMLEELKCYEESSGMVFSGWNCVFDDIPHLCVYEPHKNWVTPEQEVIYSPENTRKKQRRSVKMDFKRIEENLMDVDYMGALSKLLKYLWNHMTPWFRKDVDDYYSSTGTTLGLHVRRGDKITTGEASFKHVDVYLKAAVEYLEKESTEMNVDDIKSIYVASDDPSVLYEVRNHYMNFFPNISEESVIFSKHNNPEMKRVTRSKYQGYLSLVELIADIEKLSDSEVFVGTFSSNIGRLVTVLREFSNKKRESSISVDVNWFPG